MAQPQTPPQPLSMSERKAALLKIIREQTTELGYCPIDKIRDRRALGELLNDGGASEVQEGHIIPMSMNPEDDNQNKPLVWQQRVAKGKPAKYKGRGANRIMIAPEEPGLPYDWTEENMKNEKYLDLKNKIETRGRHGFYFGEGFMFWFMMGGIARRDLKVMAAAKKAKQRKITVT